MVDIPLLLAFLAAAAILTITPGLDTAMVLRSATVDGRRPAVMASIGIALGCLVWGAAVSLGLGALLRASELAYTILKFAGAAYLMWLGAKLLLKPRIELDNLIGEQANRGGRDAFWRGLLTNLLNPKIGVFYITFLPLFVPAGAGVAVYSFFLACLHILISLIWFGVLIAATAPLGRFLHRPGAVTIMDRLTGAVFMGFALKLATSPTR